MKSEKEAYYNSNVEIPTSLTQIFLEISALVSTVRSRDQCVKKNVTMVFGPVRYDVLKYGVENHIFHDLCIVCSGP